MAIRWQSAVLGSAIMLLGFAPRADAQCVAGSGELCGIMGITGSVTVSATDIDWFPPEGGDGTFVVRPPTTGYFTDPGNGGPAIYVPDPTVTGESLDLTTNPANDPPFTLAAVGSPISVTDFLNGFTNNTNTEYDDLTFELTMINPATGSEGTCTGAIAVGESCDLGPFLVTQATATSLTISMSLEGIFRDPSLGLTSLLATGEYSTQGILLGSDGSEIGTVPQLLAILESGGNISATYSATYRVPAAPDGEIPEPGTLLLLGSGSALLALRRRRRSNGTQ